MRTKAEIKDRIAMLRRERDALKIVLREHGRLYRQAMNAQIRALEFALGHKTGEWYWCIACNLAHKKLRCPKCKNDVYVGKIRQGFPSYDHH